MISARRDLSTSAWALRLAFVTSFLVERGLTEAETAARMATESALVFSLSSTASHGIRIDPSSSLTGDRARFFPDAVEVVVGKMSASVGGAVWS
jgi:hypothetical protein